MTPSYNTGYRDFTTPTGGEGFKYQIVTYNNPPLPLWGAVFAIARVTVVLKKINSRTTPGSI